VVVTALAWRPAGVVGGVPSAPPPSDPFSVVTLTELLRGPSLPAASTAEIRYRYVVEGWRLRSVNDVDDGVPTATSSRYTT
jgi:hypothetical protein